jgi:hypothetical protein
MTPDSRVWPNDLNDPALAVGFTFTDPVSGVIITALDAGDGAAQIAVELPVATPGGNAAPEAADDAASTIADIPVEVDVIANDRDPDGDPLSVVSVTRPSRGAVRVTQDGRVEYTPAKRYAGTDSFAYTISDGMDSASAVVTVTVSDNDPGNGKGGGNGGGKGQGKKP